jgi:hypothetical protein
MLGKVSIEMREELFEPRLQSRAPPVQLLVLTSHRIES